ncbi:UDP-N-acetylglucosamine 1-carboxyvinyltransferase [Mycoplasmatota bacterium zrk1]
MKSLKIIGGNHLSGDVIIDGAKNSALPIIAASLLCEESVLSNIPNITDVLKMLDILKIIGCEYKIENKKVVINSSGLKSNVLDNSLISDIRGSYYLMGVLINIFDSLTINYPGGCKIGDRPINFHLDGFKQLGIEVKEEENQIQISKKEILGGKITLPKSSVGATINLIFASVKCKGVTVIENASIEPEVEDVISFLNLMGAKISWIDNKVVEIRGVTKLNNVEFKIKPDRIEAGTYAVIGALFGEVRLFNVNIHDMRSTLNVLEELGCEISYNDNILKVKRKELKKVDIVTNPYPGFPTDLQQPFTVVLTQVGGSVTDNIFNNRFSNCLEINKMNGDIAISDDSIRIKPTKLKGTKVKANNLRGGMSLVLAGLIAEGETTVENIEIIERGYPNFINKLLKLGAKII